jgi:hypothetical protein
VASRAEIRLAVAELLKGRTNAGTRVASSRATPVWKQGLPAIAVYTGRDEYEISVEAPREYQVRTEVAVELFVEETTAGLPDELIDLLEAQVFAVLTSDPTLGIDQFVLEPVSFATDFNANAKRPLGGARFLWRATHYREAPEGELGEMGLFETAHVETDLAPADQNLDSVDDVHPEQ